MEQRRRGGLALLRGALGGVHRVVLVPLLTGWLGVCAGEGGGFSGDEDTDGDLDIGRGEVERFGESLGDPLDVACRSEKRSDYCIAAASA